MSERNAKETAAAGDDDSSVFEGTGHPAASKDTYYRIKNRRGGPKLTEMQFILNSRTSVRRTAGDLTDAGTKKAGREQVSGTAVSPGTVVSQMPV
jgi:hypothetical protein